MIAIIAAFCVGLGLSEIFSGKEKTEPERVVVTWDDLMSSIPAEAVPKDAEDSFERVGNAFKGDLWNNRTLGVRGKGIARNKGSSSTILISMPPIKSGTRELKIEIRLVNAVKDGRWLNEINVEPGDEVEFYGSNKGIIGPLYYKRPDGDANLQLSMTDGIIELAKKSKERREKEERARNFEK